MNKDLQSKLKDYSKLINYADIEAKGFWSVVNTMQDIWCLCSVIDDPDTNEQVVLLFHDYPEYDNAKVWDKEDQKEYIIPERVGTLLDGFRYWYTIGKHGGKLSVHNCMTYDKPIIEKIMPKCIIPVENWIDTFTQSKVQYFERSCPRGAKSGHGLLAYGIKNGIKKPPIDDWTTMDPYKLHRVIEDVKIQRMAHVMLEKEADMLKKKLGIDFTDAIAIENEYARGNQRQEVRGVLVDVDHMKSCIAWLDNETERLATDIEPTLPPTIKVNGSRISRSEMAELFGHKGVVRDQYKLIKRNGEMINTVVKPYFKPTINFHKEIKTNNYSGFHVSYGLSPSYVKKADLTKWIKENHPDTKPKDWDIEKTQIVTKVLNKVTCDYWGLEETDLDYVVGAHTKVKFIESKMSQHEVVKGKLISMGWKDAFEWNLKKDSDKQTVRAEEDMWISYPPKAAYENQMHYFVKRGQPVVTSPKLTEKDHQFLPEGLGEDIAHYNTYSHRRRFLENPKDPDNKGLLSYVRDDGRIPAGVNNFGTATSRS